LTAFYVKVRTRINAHTFLSRSKRPRNVVGQERGGEGRGGEGLRETPEASAIAPSNSASLSTIFAGDIPKYMTAVTTTSCGAGVVVMIGVVVAVVFGWHGPPSGPRNPALHVHAVAAVLPAKEFELAAQAVHSASPLSALNLPAAQAMQSPAPERVSPTSHLKKQLT
jgi:hypothetical protein